MPLIKVVFLLLKKLRGVVDESFGVGSRFWNEGDTG
jgi:hypothetical protein